MQTLQAPQTVPPSSLETVSVTIDDFIGRVELNRPKKRNAMSLQLFAELRQAIDFMSQCPDVRVVIVSGAGAMFTAGIDIGALMQLSQVEQHSDEARKRYVLRTRIMELQDCMTCFARCQKPVLCCVHGKCLGAGFNVITACDMIFCTDDAQFSIKEIDLGITADIGVLQRLPAFVSRSVAMEWALGGHLISAQEAHSRGLVNATFQNKPDMMHYVVDVFAKSLAQKSPLALMGTKRMVNRSYDPTRAVASELDYMATWNAAMLLGDDVQEAIQAQMLRIGSKGAAVPPPQFSKL